jgi:hypothetical protein
MDDLFFQMKLAETAKHLGVEVKVAATPDALQGLLTPAPKLLIVDLNSRNCRTCRRTWPRRLAPRVATK